MTLCVCVCGEGRGGERGEDDGGERGEKEEDRRKGRREKESDCWSSNDLT